MYTKCRYNCIFHTYNSSRGSGLSMYVRFFVVLQDNHDTKDLLDALVALKHRSRTWLLFGHSHDEQEKTGPDVTTSTGRRSARPGSGDSGSRIVPLYGNPDEESAKTGRNNPCACGSGKKYKNAAGNRGIADKRVVRSGTKFLCHAPSCLPSNC